MQQHELRQPDGATHKKKRVGRGNASGHGTYSTKGLKGQKARSGGGVRPGFEGGQLPFVRRMAYKRGFKNPFRVDYEEVNVGDLAAFKAGTDVTVDLLRESRLIRTKRPAKVLGEGDLSVALKVTADSFSKSARAKIEAAGGTITWIGGEPVPEEKAAPAEDTNPKRAPKVKKADAAEAEVEAVEEQKDSGEAAGEAPGGA
jgi:large subunit ribosomal protein L15